jgi:hypothetical protein
MNKRAFSAALLAIGFLVPGCPVYDTNDIGCFDDFDCPYGYVCDEGSALCVSTSHSSKCSAPNDCGLNETCSRSGTCLPGDCHFDSVGCVHGYECSSASGRWECVRPGEDGAGGAASESAVKSGESNASGSPSGGESPSGGSSG